MTINTAKDNFRSYLATQGLKSTRQRDIILDSFLSQPPFQKSGYAFAIASPGALGTSAAPNLTFRSTADPFVPGQTGVRHYFSDDSNVIRFNATAPATPNDAPLQ